MQQRADVSEVRRWARLGGGSSRTLQFALVDLELPDNLVEGRHRLESPEKETAPVFDRFTDRARKVMGLARQEAQRLGHDYIGTEHVLLGLIEEGNGVASDVLKSLDVDLKKIRQEVEKLVSPGNTMVTMGQLPFTPRAKKVLELALEEASNLGHNYIGTEHLLFGLIREQEGIAAQALQNIKVRLEDVREEVLELLGAEPDEETVSRLADVEIGHLEFGKQALSSARGLLERIRELEERIRKLEEKDRDR